MYAKTFAQLVESVNSLESSKLAAVATRALSLVEKHERGESRISPQSLQRCRTVLEVAAS